MMDQTVVDRFMVANWIFFLVYNWKETTLLVEKKIILLPNECQASDGGFSSCLATTDFPKKHMFITANQKRKVL